MSGGGQRAPARRLSAGSRERSSSATESSLIRLHVLHHAAREPIYGLAIIEDLARHGYRMSPGTLYPLLKGLHARGYLRVRDVREGKRMRRLYTATAQGKRALEDAKKKVQELFGELLEEE